MHKEAGKIDVPFVYSLFVEQENGTAPLLVMDGFVPTFADLDTLNDFIENVVKKHIPPEAKIIIKKVVLNEYVEDKGQSDRTSKSKTKRSNKGRNRRNRKD